MSEADRLKWDERYAGPTYRMGARPRPFLMEVADLLPLQGQAMDLAAGEGQSAIFLARRGLEVTAVDVSAVGLAKARELAAASGVALTTRAVDLAVDPSPLARGALQLVTCFHYLQRDLIPQMAAALAPGGMIAMEIAGAPNLERHAHPSRRYLVEPGEMASWFPSLRLRFVDEGWREGSWVSRILVQRERPS